MATRMNPIAGRYFNSPQFAQAFSNLASAFGPPSAGDMLQYEQLRGERAQNSRLSALWGAAGDDFDRMGVASGQWNPTQSYYAVDQSNATARRGQDVTAETSRSNNLRDNQFDLAGTLATNNLEYGEAMPGLPPEVAEALGLPVAIPSVTGAELGAAAPLPTESEVKGQILQGLSPDEQRALGLSGVETETVVGEGGKPTFATPYDALGREAYVNQGGKAAAELYQYQTPDGHTGSAVFDPNTQQLKDAATGEPLPAGTATAKIEGASRSDALGSTTANQTEANTVVAEANFGMERAKQFRSLLEQNPGILGVPGMVRGFAQDVAQAAIEMGTAFGTDGTLGSLQEVQALGQQIAQSNGYDPAFAQAAALALEMAYMDAKMQDPSGEVNVRELERMLSVYDGGIAGNQRVLAALDNLDSRLVARRDIYAQQLRDPAGAVPSQPGAGGAGEARIPAVTSDADYDALPSGAMFLDPEGNQRRKP